MASIFTKIINGELPGHFVWRDDKAVAIMTIAPIKPGHCLVIPVQEVDHWDDVPADLAAHLMQVAQKVAKGLKAVYSPKRVGVMVAGLEVPHTHLHLIPVDALEDFDFSLQKPTEAEQLAAESQKIRAALKELGYAEAECG
ncbi:HIT family protein [Microbulbifer thermotolerans]|uniref:HIT family hydrolase n=1 Tax=Microbulbifer thermotolerans TaxID=252514 RepID=A0A143HNA5_MICTH|nr:HIT family protein [Microbulbifer thermotolerans]AMX02752.1 HIT family hydrolase [Microbulbifer thermotolerans]MCX2779607.1 HIT family protein [Microbulbifer thermotolerans]MCX2782573.1 HIT family protein [Microbulbifer thermotolerans]MCX2794585.1 HIT family protein [Microbulbifer thermotolerans]MCX2801413.1 HIT family protein [Microbulbifer thermotolerans]